MTTGQMIHLPRAIAAVELPGDVREQGASRRGLRRALLTLASQDAAGEAIGGLGFGT